MDPAIHHSDSPISLNSIAERQDLSLGYMEQVFSVLRQSRFINSIKGAQGGYILADNPANITVGDVLRALGHDSNVVDEAEQQEVSKKSIEYCIKTMVWDKMNESLNKVADSITLEDLVTQYQKLSNSWVHMYYI